MQRMGEIAQRHAGREGHVRHHRVLVPRPAANQSNAGDDVRRRSSRSRSAPDNPEQSRDGDPRQADGRSSRRSRRASRWCSRRRRCAASATPAGSRCRSRTAPARRRRRSCRRSPSSSMAAARRTRRQFARRCSAASAPTCRSSTSTSTATKVKQQGVDVTDVFETLQVYLGCLYVNDFNFLGRTYQVIGAGRRAVPRDRRRRRAAQDAQRRRARWCRWAPCWTSRTSPAPIRISRYNLYPAADINGTPRPASAAAQAIALMEQLAADNLPAGLRLRVDRAGVPGKARRQHRAAGSSRCACCSSCSSHAAEYESLSLSTAIILIVPMCLLARHRRRVAARDGQQHLHADRLRRARGPVARRTPC